MSSECSRGAGSLANTIGLALLSAMLAIALPAAAVSAEPAQEQAMSAPAAPPSEMQADMSYKEMAAMMGMDDAAAFSKVMLDQLELEADSDHTLFSWGGQAWYGSDYNKVWLKSEGSPNASDKTDARNELLWDRIVTRWWSVQTGVRYDFGQGPARGWAAAGIEGLAPYWFDLEATFYVGEEGRTAARLRAERDLLITQRLIVQPEFEANLYGTNRLGYLGSAARASRSLRDSSRTCALRRSDMAARLRRDRTVCERQWGSTRGSVVGCRSAHLVLMIGQDHREIQQCGTEQRQ